MPRMFGTWYVTLWSVHHQTLSSFIGTASFSYLRRGEFLPPLDRDSLVYILNRDFARSFLLGTEPALQWVGSTLENWLGLVTRARDRDSLLRRPPSVSCALPSVDGRYWAASPLAVHVARRGALCCQHLHRSQWDFLPALLLPRIDVAVIVGTWLPAAKPHHLVFMALPTPQPPLLADWLHAHPPACWGKPTAPHLLTPGPRRRCSVERRVCVEPLGSPGRPIPEPRSSLFLLPLSASLRMTHCLSQPFNFSDQF